MSRITPKVEPQADEYTGELEFSKPADRLIEAIRHRLSSQGEEVSREKVLLIAKQVLESRDV